MNGEIRINRTILRIKRKDEKTGETERKAEIVLDDYFHLKQYTHKVTSGLMREICFWAQNQSSYENAQEIMRNKIGITISDEYIRTIAMEVGGRIYEEAGRAAEDREHLSAEIPAKPSKKGMLYLMVDGSMIQTREKEADGAAKWREVKLGMVFNSNDVKEKAGGKKHTIKQKDYAVSTSGVAEFSKYLFECAVRNGYGTYEQTIIVSDGAPWIRNMCSELFPDAIQILDFYHLAEHVYDAGKILFNDDAQKYVPWAENIIALLRNSEANRVFSLLLQDDIIHYDCVVKLYNYMYNNREKIDYAAYVRKGYFIGSGPIESANKVVVQRRCKQSGMRWNLPTAQCMLTLRSTFESGNWYSLAKKFFAAA
jgi:hypothetical protein